MGNCYRMLHALLSCSFVTLLSCYCYALTPVGKGAISVASVRPSHTQRIIRQPKGLVCPNLEGRFPTLDATCIPVWTSNCQRSGSPGPLMLTHCDTSCAISSEWQGLRTSNLVYGRRTTTRISHRRHVAPVNVISSHRLYISCLPLLNSRNKMLYLSLEAGGGIPCRWNPVATLLVSFELNKWRWRNFDSHVVVLASNKFCRVSLASGN